jgi:hypothetical protein
VTAAVHEARQTSANVPKISMGERRGEEREWCGVYWVIFCLSVKWARTSVRPDRMDIDGRAPTFGSPQNAPKFESVLGQIERREHPLLGWVAPLGAVLTHPTFVFGFGCPHWRCPNNNRCILAQIMTKHYRINHQWQATIKTSITPLSVVNNMSICSKNGMNNGAF